MRVYDILRARLVTGYQPVPIDHGPLVTPADDPWDPALAPAAPAPSGDRGLRMRDLDAASVEAGGGVRVEIYDFAPGAPGAPNYWTAAGARDTIPLWRWLDASGLEIQVGAGRLSDAGRANYVAVAGHAALTGLWIHPFSAASRRGGSYVWPWGAPGAPDEHAVHQLHAADPAGWRTAVVDTGGPSTRDSGGVWPQRPGPDGAWAPPVPVWAGGPYPDRRFRLRSTSTPRSPEPRPWAAPPAFPAGVELEFGPLGGKPGERQDLDERATRDWALTAVTAPGGATDTGFGPDPYVDRRARVFFMARARPGLAYPPDTAEHWLDLIASNLVRMRGAGDDADGHVVLPARPDLGWPAQVIDVHYVDVEAEPFFLRLDAAGRPIYQLGVHLHYAVRS